MNVQSEDKTVMVVKEGFVLEIFRDWDEVNTFIDELQEAAMKTFGKPWENSDG